MLMEEDWVVLSQALDQSIGEEEWSDMHEGVTVRGFSVGPLVWFLVTFLSLSGSCALSCRSHVHASPHVYTFAPFLPPKNKVPLWFCLTPKEFKKETPSRHRSRIRMGRCTAQSMHVCTISLAVLFGLDYSNDFGAS